ncbi:MAG: transcriptional regulator NrdR [Kiritimatiellia bacterium]
MRCPKCSHTEDKVLDSRVSRSGAATRRRRSCLNCGYRFTTYEEVLRPKLKVIKTDGRHEAFDRTKLQNGIERACEKRPISSMDIENLVDALVEEVESEYEREVSSDILGQKVMDRLEKLDEVAFVRFASVYRRFRDVNQFVNAIQDMMGKP